MSDKEKFMQECDEITTSEFLKEILYEQEGVTKSEALAINKQAAAKAQVYGMLARQNGENANASRWTNLAWDLRKAK